MTFFHFLLCRVLQIVKTHEPLLKFISKHFFFAIQREGLSTSLANDPEDREEFSPLQINVQSTDLPLIFRVSAFTGETIQKEKPFSFLFLPEDVFAPYNIKILVRQTLPCQANTFIYRHYIMNSLVFQ